MGDNRIYFWSKKEQKQQVNLDAAAVGFEELKKK